MQLMGLWPYLVRGGVLPKGGVRSKLAALRACFVHVGLFWLS